MLAKRALTGMPLLELSELLGSRARALAALKWLYAQPGVPQQLPEVLPGVGHRWLSTLREHCALPELKLLERHQADDGTTRYVVDLRGSVVETVRIPSRGRSTVCLSSQAGCSRRCGFCATATLGFGRHLEAGEMVAQYLLARAQAPFEAPAKNVVFMGMGEPMDNLDEVLRACEVLTQSPAPQLGAEQITVSTSGVLPGMRRFLAEGRASLALSLNATTDEQRSALMPQNRLWPIAELLQALRDGSAANPKRVHFIEYVLFAGVNDTDEDARRLPRLLEGLNARINLIPHNPFEGNPLRAPTRAQVLRFQAQVHAAGVRCLVRWPRGQQISAACGQLARAASS